MATKSKPKDQIASPALNARWFQDRLADKKISQRQFAKLLELDPPAITRIFNGTRRLAMDEAVAFASIVGVPLEEVLRNAGLKPPVQQGKGSVPVVGWVDGQGTIHKTGAGTPNRVSIPPECPADTVALRYKAAESASNMMDGWLFYYAGAERVPPEAIGRLCVLQLANKGPALLGVVRRGYELGTFTVKPWGAAELSAVENVYVDRASPILWVRTA